MPYIAYVNGRPLALAEAKVSIRGNGFGCSDGVGKMPYIECPSRQRHRRCTAHNTARTQ